MIPPALQSVRARLERSLKLNHTEAKLVTDAGDCIRQEDLHSARLSKRTSRTAEQRMYPTKPIVAQYRRLSEPSQRMRETEYVDGVLQRHQDRTTNMHDDSDSEKKNERQSKSGRGADPGVVCHQCSRPHSSFLGGAYPKKDLIESSWFWPNPSPGREEKQVRVRIGDDA